MRHVRRFVGIALVLVVAAAGLVIGRHAAATSSGPILYGVNPFDNKDPLVDPDDSGLYAFDAASGNNAGLGKKITITAGPVQLPVVGGNALSIDPTTSTAWSVLKVDNGGTTDDADRVLATINLTNGNATSIDAIRTGASKKVPVAGITFGDDGTLYAISGMKTDQTGTIAAGSGSLYTINKTTAVATLRKQLTLPNDYGAAIAYNSNDDKIYHAAGGGRQTGSGLPWVWESVDPANSYAISDIGFDENGADEPNEPIGLGFDPVSGSFIMRDFDDRVMSVTSAGLISDLASTPGVTWPRGYAVTHPTAPVAVDDLIIVSPNSLAGAVDVLANDVDGSITPVGTVQSITQPAHGTATNQTTHVSFQPTSGYCRNSNSPEDTFTYTLNTGTTAIVHIDVPCPSFTRGLTLKYSRKKGKFSGDITSGSSQCVSGATIQIFKLNQNTSDTLIGEPVTDSNGHYVLKKKAHGTYYAYIDNTHIPSTLDCDSATSDFINVKR